MTELFELRRAAREIFDEALKSLDAHDALRRAVNLDGSRLRLVDTTFDLANTAPAIYAIAIGKAALPMAVALNEVIGDHLRAGIITGFSSAPNMPERKKLIRQRADEDRMNGEEAHARLQRDASRLLVGRQQRDAWVTASPVEPSLSRRWRVFAGGHPLPNEDSLHAAQVSFELLKRADAEHALVIFLISGGGSAMIEWARDEKVTLAELRAANQVLVSCGASITEINTVRCAFSAVKGGSLAACAPHTDQVSLIISDTNAGEEQRVASGPTFEPPPPNGLDAREVIARYGLAERLPASILRAIRQPPATEAAETPPHSLRKHYVLLDNRRALLRAAEAARRRGLTVEIAHDLVEQGIAEGSAQLCARLNDLHRRVSSERHRSSSSQAVCLISGGEFACPVEGDGVGGRNAETVLRCAIEIDARVHTYGEGGRHSRPAMHTVALSAGTDGIDGNSPAAGALADETTVARAHAMGLDAQSFLDRSDAYTFFNTLGDAIVTGATATNVRDLRIMLQS